MRVIDRMPASTAYSGSGTSTPGLRRPGIHKRPLHPNHANRVPSSNTNVSVDANKDGTHKKPRFKRGIGFQPGPLLQKFMLPVLSKYAIALDGDWGSVGVDGDELLGQLWKLWMPDFMETVYPNSRSKMEKWLAGDWKDSQASQRFIQLVSSLPTVLSQTGSAHDYTALLAWCGHLHQLRRQARKKRAREARRLRIADNIRWHRYLVAFGLESNHPLVGCRLDMPSFLISLATGSSRKSHLSEGL